MTTNGHNPAKPIPSKTKAIWTSSIQEPRRWQSTLKPEVGDDLLAIFMDLRTSLEANYDIGLTRRSEVPVSPPSCVIVMVPDQETPDARCAAAVKVAVSAQVTR